MALLCSLGTCHRLCVRACVAASYITRSLLNGTSGPKLFVLYPGSAIDTAAPAPVEKSIDLIRSLDLRSDWLRGSN